MDPTAYLHSQALEPHSNPTKGREIGINPLKRNTDFSKNWKNDTWAREEKNLIAKSSNGSFNVEKSVP